MDGLLPGIGGIWDDEAKLEIPLFHAAALEEDALLQAQPVQHLLGGKLKFPRHGSALKYRFRQGNVSLHHQITPVLLLPEDAASRGVRHVHPVDLEPIKNGLRTRVRWYGSGWPGRLLHPLLL